MIIVGNLVKYHSDVNKIPLRNFNEKELNLFFSLLFKAKQKGTSKIIINFTDLRKISNGDTHSDRFIKSLKNLSKKLLSVNLEQVLPDERIAIFNIFNEFIIDLSKKELEIQIHERFYYMLNDFLTYTQFELQQLVGLRSSYSKNIFRLLKQFESTNFLSIYIDEFKRILCIPESYRMCEIDRTVIKPAMIELSPLFPNLKLEKIKDGRKIKTLKFTWGNRCFLENKEKQPVIEVNISEQLNKIIEKTKKNRFIQPLLTVSNIEKLIKKYPEDLLIKGLNFAVQEINYEIKALSYLEKTIDTGIENSKKKIVVTKKDPSLLPEREKMSEGQMRVNDQLEESNTDSKFTISPIEEFKAEVAKWCMKNKKYPLFGELEDISSLRELGKFLEKYKIEI